MIRTGRAVAALLTVGATFALSACGATERTVATVGGATITRDDVETLGRAYLAQPDAAGGEDGPDDRLSAQLARGLLQRLIIGHIIGTFLDERGAMPTAEELAAAPLESWQEELPDAVRRPLQLAALGPGDVGSISSEEAAAIYAEPAAESGILCPRFILVDTEADADDVVAELDAGADFATLAAERSTDPTGANGGVADPSNPMTQCLDMSGLPPDSPEAAAANPLTPGAWSPPTEVFLQDGSSAWLVLLARPYDDVSESVDAAAASRALDVHASAVEIDVDPMYGRWDADQLAVVSL